jgi:hypothetical protein
VAYFAKKRHRCREAGFCLLEHAKETSMRRLPVAAVLLLIAVASHAQTLGPVDWIFLVDTSKSMRGVGPGAKDIWSDVQDALNTFVREAGKQDTATLYAFDRDVRIVDDPEHALFKLKPEGNRTHLGAAIAQGLDRAGLLRRMSRDATRRQVVVLFTDGKEDVRGIKNRVRIDTNIDRAGETFLFFVSMGEHEPQLDAFARSTKHTTVLKAPTAEEIRDVAQKIRAQIPPPPPPPKPKVIPRVAPPPPVEKKSPWIATSIVLALLALIAFIVFRQQQKKNRLEGEIEILRPHSAFVGLPNLQANEVALSAILPVDALSGSDARLFVRRKAGRKKVWIAAQSGSLRINDVETPMSELYDADTIEIGDAKLRFNRAGDERPLDFNQEADL